MKTTRLFMSVFVMVLIAGMFASDARQAVIGSGYISDENDIITNPAYAMDYENFARLELGNFGANNSWATANIYIHNNLVIGGHFNREDGAIFDMVDDFSAIPAPINGIGLYGATSFGDMNVGLGIYNAANKSITENEPETGSDMTTTLKSGVFQVLAGVETGPIAASFGVGFNSFEETDDPGDEFKSAGGMELYAEIYSEFELSNKMTLVPIGSFNSYKYNTESVISDVSNESGDMSFTAFSVGVAGNIDIGDEGIFSAGAALDMMTDKDESVENITNTTTWTNMPRINLAVEMPIIEKDFGKSDVPMKCIARAGVRKSMGKLKEMSETETEKITTSTTYSESNADFIAVGLGVEVSNFYLDMTISENIFYTGTYIISGNPQNLSANVSLGYGFGN